MTQPFPFTYRRPTVPVGIAAGNALYWPIENDNVPSYVPLIDFTTVTLVTLKVTRQRDGSTATWATSTFLSVTASGLVAVYQFSANGLDCPIDGDYLIRPYLSIPSFPVAVPCERQHLTVEVP